MCGQSGHVKKNHPKGGACLASGCRSINRDIGNDANIFSLSPWKIIVFELRQVRPYDMSLSCHVKDVLKLAGPQICTRALVWHGC